MRKRTRCLYDGATYDLSTNTGVCWLNTASGAEGPPPPDAQDEPAVWTWRQGNYTPHCQAGHPLLTKDAIVCALFGETLAGKGHLVKTARSLFNASELIDREISATLDPDHATEFRARYENEGASKPASIRDPRTMQFISIQSPRRKGSVDLIVFDTAGEDMQAAKVRTACPFIPEADVFIFVVPPPCLPDLPEGVRLGRDDYHQSLDATIEGFNSVIKRLDEETNARHRKRHGLISVLALSKCDRYRGVDGFPPEMLVPRRNRISWQAGSHNIENTREVMYREQQPLYEFIDRYGGMPLLQATSRVTGTVFISAVSGTGNDIRGMAPAQAAAPNRALDPFSIALMRQGIGQFGRPGPIGSDIYND